MATTLTATERLVVLGLAGRHPHRAELTALSRRDVIGVAEAINYLIGRGYLDRDARPAPLAIAQAEAEEAGEY